MKIYNVLIFVFLLFTVSVMSQDTLTIKGYVSKARNTGYIKGADVFIKDFNSGNTIYTSTTDVYGNFEAKIKVSDNYKYLVSVSKEEYYEQLDTVFPSKENESRKIFLKYLLKRKPGYRFELSLTDLRVSPDAPVDGITDALIEVYNNTENKLVASFKNEVPEFDFNLNKGNHYTVLIRKDGYLAKKLEAYLNVNGCIICFDGVSRMRPGVKADLYDNNTIGNYRANIELDKLFEGKKFQVNNIYYGLDKSHITAKAKKELDNLANILVLHKNLTVELGSHTDSRGSDNYNLELSTKRAQEAVNYLVNEGRISKHRIKYKGYGEKELKNHCDDGVKCSEAEHSINRRTEIKILNIEEADPNDFVSLEAIKNQEKFEERYRQMIHSDSEIIEVKGDDIPSELKNEIKKDNRAKEEVQTKTKIEQNIKEKEETKPIKEDIKVVKEKEKPQSKPIEESIVEPDVQQDDKKSIGGQAEVYKIVILFTRYPLPSGHILFKHIPEIEEYNDNEGGYVLYTLGNYKNKEEAEAELKKKWSKRYKKAYVAGFFNGKLVK